MYRLFALLSLFVFSLSCSHNFKFNKDVSFIAGVPVLQETNAAVYVHKLTKKGTKGPLMAVATAFAVDNNVLITANHLCELATVEGTALYLKVLNLESRLTEPAGLAHIIKTDKKNDLCAISGDTSSLRFLRMAPSHPRLLDKVYTLGAPAGLFGIMTEGTYTGVHLAVVTPGNRVSNYEVFSLPAFAGNSGGPIVNKDGQVVGIVIAGLMVYNEIALSSDYFALRDFVKSVSGE
jgi:S1-C subfamily serine protease